MTNASQRTRSRKKSKIWYPCNVLAIGKREDKKLNDNCDQWWIYYTLKFYIPAELDFGASRKGTAITKCLISHANPLCCGLVRFK